MTEDGIDRSPVRASAASADPDVFISEIRGTVSDHALQRIGAAMLRMAWTSPQSRPALIPVLRTGEVIPAVLTDPDMIGEDAAVDIDESEDDWLHVLFESHDSWNDMDEFASTITDPRVRASLQRALHGRRPFAHFRDVVHRAGIARAWYDFEEERQFGRLRDLLSQDHIHPV